MRFSDLLRSIKVPITLTLYGTAVIALQAPLIKATGLALKNSLRTWNTAAALIIASIDSGLFYLWYKIIVTVRAQELRKAQSYSGSSRSDRPS